MAGLRIDQLPMPCDRFRIDKHSADFETDQSSVKEDAKRAKMLRKLAKSRKPRRAARMLKLADTLDPSCTPQTPKTLASSRYMRVLRIPVIGAVLQLVAEHPALDICRFDIAKPSWALSPRDFRRERPNNLKAKLRADLLRSANKLGFDGVPDIEGFVLAFLHGEHTQFDDGTEHIHPHFHCLATGDWIAVIEELRKQRGYTATESSKKPIRARRKLEDLPYAFSYLLKSYWPRKWMGLVSGVNCNRRTRGHRRIPEPHHSEVLLWLHKFEPSDLILKMGVNQTRGGFSMSNL